MQPIEMTLSRQNNRTHLILHACAHRIVSIIQGDARTPTPVVKPKQLSLWRSIQHNSSYKSGLSSEGFGASPGSPACYASKFDRTTTTVSSSGVAVLAAVRSPGTFLYMYYYIHVYVHMYIHIHTCIYMYIYTCKHI